MSSTTGSGQVLDDGQKTGCYVYGIVPVDVEVQSGARGLGDPPGPLSVVPYGEIAALVGEVGLNRPLGDPADLMAYEQLLDAVAVEAPVLPLRFGAVMANAQAVAEQLLAPYHDEFLAALGELDGRAEYVVRGRYVQDALLREVLSQRPDIAHQRDSIRGGSPEATRNARIALGEAINQAINDKREADTRTVVDQVAPHSVAVNVRDVVHEEDAAHVAVLVDLERRTELEEAISKLGRDWAGRVNVRLLGPLAPYDFVVTRTQMGG